MDRLFQFDYILYVLSTLVGAKGLLAAIQKRCYLARDVHCVFHQGHKVPPGSPKSSRSFLPWTVPTLQVKRNTRKGIGPVKAVLKEVNTRTAFVFLHHLVNEDRESIS